MERIRRFTRVLVPLPPVESVHKYVREKVEKTFSVIPEFLSTPDFDGFAISWPSWYGFTAVTSTIKAGRFRSLFEDLRYEMMCGGISLEESGVIELVDENEWWYLDLEDEDIYKEVFSGVYKENDDSLTVFSDFIRFNQGPGRIFDYKLNEIHFYLEEYYEQITHEFDPWDEVEKKEKSEIIPMVESLKKLARRGIFNNLEVSSEIANDIYLRLKLGVLP